MNVSLNLNDNMAYLHHFVQVDLFIVLCKVMRHSKFDGFKILQKNVGICFKEIGNSTDFVVKLLKKIQFFSGILILKLIRMAYNSFGKL